MSLTLDTIRKIFPPSFYRYAVFIMGYFKIIFDLIDISLSSVLVFTGIWWSDPISIIEELNIDSSSYYMGFGPWRPIIRIVCAYILVWSGALLLLRCQERFWRSVELGSPTTFLMTRTDYISSSSPARSSKPQFPTGPIRVLPVSSEQPTEGWTKAEGKRTRFEWPGILEEATVCSSESSSLPMTPVSECYDEVSPIAHPNVVPDTIAMIWKTVHHENNHAVWSDCACCRNTC